jgi:Holliday junction resolvase RusA-like endonuclease
MIEIKFKLNPIPKGRARFGNGRAFTPSRTREFENAVKLIAKHWMRLNGKIDPLRGPLEVLIHFHLKKPKTVTRELPAVKPDLDNLMKAVFDGCNEILWLDDSQICMVSCVKTYSSGEGHIDMIVKEI